MKYSFCHCLDCAARATTPPAPLLSQMNPVHTFSSWLFNIHFNIILQCMLRSSEWSVSLRTVNQQPYQVRIFLIGHSLELLSYWVQICPLGTLWHAATKWWYLHFILCDIRVMKFNWCNSSILKWSADVICGCKCWPGHFWYEQVCMLTSVPPGRW